MQRGYLVFTNSNGNSYLHKNRSGTDGPILGEVRHHCSRRHFHCRTRAKRLARTIPTRGWSFWISCKTRNTSFPAYRSIALSLPILYLLHSLKKQVIRRRNLDMSNFHFRLWTWAVAASTWAVGEQTWTPPEPSLSLTCDKNLSRIQTALLNSGRQGYPA
jgi:hypothetical protein